MTNKEKINQAVSKLGYSMGCYDNTMDKLNKQNLKKILDSTNQDYADVEVNINRKKHVVEIATVDSEKDFQILSKEEYIDRCGECD